MKLLGLRAILAHLFRGPVQTPEPKPEPVPLDPERVEEVRRLLAEIGVPCDHAKVVLYARLPSDTWTAVRREFEDLRAAQVSAAISFAGRDPAVIAERRAAKEDLKRRKSPNPKE